MSTDEELEAELARTRFVTAEVRRFTSVFREQIGEIRNGNHLRFARAIEDPEVRVAFVREMNRLEIGRRELDESARRILGDD